MKPLLGIVAVDQVHLRGIDGMEVGPALGGFHREARVARRAGDNCGGGNRP